MSNANLDVSKLIISGIIAIILVCGLVFSIIKGRAPDVSLVALVSSVMGYYFGRNAVDGMP